VRGLKAAAGAADASTLDWSLDHAEPGEARVISLTRRGDATSEWVSPVVRRIKELANLETDDLPLHIEDVGDALDFLSRVMAEDTSIPWIGKLSSGGVQLAWKHADVEVEAVFDRMTGERELLVTVGENEWDCPVDRSDSLFFTVRDRLSNSYIAHTAEAVACG
jgi:hypothetical protein